MSGREEEAKLQLALRALPLKDQRRTGWVQHGVRDAESVAAHSWGTAYLCLLFAEEAGVDEGKALAIAVVHDLAEATTGDFANRLDPADRQVSEAAKAEAEFKAMEELLPVEQGHLRAYWMDYEQRTSPEARFVRDMNLIDMCLQALAYEREGRYDAGVLVPSQGGHRHLDEFLEGARRRLESALARRLFAVVHGWYLEARDGRPEAKP